MLDVVMFIVQHLISSVMGGSWEGGKIVEFKAGDLGLRIQVVKIDLRYI